ncbi:MAG TPA: hypothetical protein VGG11_00960 [Xanthobacteraceae bacterium]
MLKKMNIFRLGLFAFAAFTGLTILVGCDTNESVLSKQPTSQIGPATGSAENAQADHRTSWMAPGANKDDLLYVSDQGTREVYVFSYPQGALVGTLTGFVNPRGECIDRTGNVWIVDLGSGPAASVLKYTHGGTTPIRTIQIKDEYPYGCSVDHTTGNLAVTYFADSYGSTQGAVEVYERAKAHQIRRYVDPSIYHYVLCDYDNQGNLYVDGFGTGSAFEFGEIPRGSSSFTNITLNQAIDAPGGVKWDGKHVVVGDLDNDVIYQFTISGGQGDEVGSTPLDGASYVEQFWIQNHDKVIGPSNGSGSVMFWKYPAGGKPTEIITGFEYPFGSVISKAR